MKVKCKLQDYDEGKRCWEQNEDRVIVERPWNGTDLVLIRIEDKEACVLASELIDAIKACAR